MKLHLGCGSRDFGPEWIHIDGGDFPHVKHHDIVHLPFDDGSVDLIYACHVFEYFDQSVGQHLLRRWHAKLKEGGVLRLAVPDFGRMARLYAAGACALQDIIGPLFGKMKMNDESIYHKTTYDQETLTAALKGAGFKSVQPYDWATTEHAGIDDHSRSHLPHDIDAIRTMSYGPEHTLISLNLEAIK